MADVVEWRDLVGEHGPTTQSFQTTSANLETGVKLRATKGRGLVPQSALVATVFLPTGYGSSAGDRVAPQLDYIYSWSLTDVWSFYGSTGAILGRHGSQGTDQWFQSLVLSQKWSDAFSTFGEWYVIDNQTALGGSTPQTVDAGVQWRPLASMQFDWRAGCGLNNAADDFFTGVGFSTRY